MPRKGRINIAGGIYHVIQRGIERCNIFREDADREELLRRLAEGIAQTGHRCYGWALMPNHFHLVMRTGKKPLSDLMRKVLTGYAIYFNKKYKRCGYLYQNRYKSILCQEEEYLLELIRYVHLNPLRAKIVNSMEELNGFKWCGHSVLTGEQKVSWQATGEILERFGATRREAAKKYTTFMDEAKAKGRRHDFSGGGLRRSAGGWTRVACLQKANERWQGDERILGDGDFVNEALKESEYELREREKLKREGWNMEKLIQKVCEKYSLHRKHLQQRGRENKIAEAKMMFAYIGNKKLGISSIELAKVMNCNKSGVGYLVRQCREKFGEEVSI